MTRHESKLPCPKSGAELLEMYYLEVRCNLLDAAATFDRLERSGDWDQIKDDPRLEKLRKSLEILGSDGADRAERFLNLFSV